MTTQQFYNEIEGILEIPAGSIKGNESLADFEQWDSLALLTFISMIDTHLNILVSASELAKCGTVADLMNMFPGKISAAPGPEQPTTDGSNPVAKPNLTYAGS